MFATYVCSLIPGAPFASIRSTPIPFRLSFGHRKKKYQVIVDFSLDRAFGKDTMLSPVLFTVFLQDVFRKLYWAIFEEQVNGEHINHPIFTDDSIFPNDSSDDQ